LKKLIKGIKISISGTVMIVINGTGCSLVDNLYAHCDFSSPVFKQFLSREEADGGLSPGKLVFAENFEHFTGKPYEIALAQISSTPPDLRNLGGPSVVSLAHAAQILADKAEVRFFGVKGNDEYADFIESAIKKFPFKEYLLVKKDFPSPRTDVLSDPNYDNGHGERTFINLPGAANHFYPSDLPANFFNSDITEFGGTALIPHIQESLTELLKRAKEAGALTVVNLVYDFHSELKNHEQKWKIGENDDAYQHIDILIADKDEALRTTGASSTKDAINWLISRGTGAAIITEGARAVTFAAGKGVFSPVEIMSVPVCEEIDRELETHPENRGDTTGCGDNFAGGVIASIAEQLMAGQKGRLDIRECIIQGVPAGGFACFTVGGPYNESFPGEKRNRLELYVEAYRGQLAEIH
jgi:sugar/nucleoside kinase (ribokinase family)